MKVIVLIDGEHYIPVIQDAIASIKEKEDVLAAIFIGGTEKIGDPEELKEELGIDVLMGKGDEIPYDKIEEALKRYRPDALVDLSDEPIVDYRSRFKMASLSLESNVSYIGSDFRFDPPEFLDLLEKPSIGIIGTGKRIGKTAVAGYIARLLKERGYDPVIVTMGRGGPKIPEIIYGEEMDLSPEYLIEQASKGIHAASDHWEDAMTSRITTVGCRRCGGGMAGRVFVSNVVEGVEVANKLEKDLMIMEGSGAALPPIKTDRRIVIVGANQPIEFISGYFGTYRIHISDLAILTMCEEPIASKEKILNIVDAIKDIKEMEIFPTVFRPRPLGDVNGKKIFLAVTTPREMIENVMGGYLEDNYGCEVVGYSPFLSNRRRLIEDLKDYIEGADTILTEIKAAGIDVATKFGIDNNLDVIYMDNIIETIGQSEKEFHGSILSIVEEAIDNFG